MSTGNKLQCNRSLRDAFGIKGNRQKIVVTNNPPTIDQNQLLTVRFPNLDTSDIIVPGTTKLTFDITLNSTDDANRTLISNIGRAIVKKKVVKIEGNEILSIDDSDTLDCYYDLWMSGKERQNAVFQGIVTGSVKGQRENAIKHRINAGDKADDVEDQAIATAFGNKFCIPLDFEILESSMPFYQSGLSSRLSYELTFNEYKKVIKSSKTDATYAITNISLEFDTISNSKLASDIKTEYMRTSILYDRILRHRHIVLKDSETVWNLNFNTPAKSLKGILMLFTKESDWARDTEKFYNPKITNIEVAVEGKPNQLYAQGMKTYHQFDEIRKHFGAGRLKEHGSVQSELNLFEVRAAEYYTSKYGLWLDFRSTDDCALHGTGRRIENASEGITIAITKVAGTGGNLQCFIYLFMDAQINIKDGKFVNIMY